jgi:TfoX/Sxy family transcriptional regulator of competence genes
MAYDEKLADRIRAILDDRSDVSERKMFGGLAFLVSGRMCVGIVGEDLMVRVGKDALEEAVRAPHARPMDFTGRPATGMVYVAPAGVKTTAGLRKWVEKGVELVVALPVKKGPVEAGRQKKPRTGERASVPRATDPRLARLLRSLKADGKLAPIALEFEERAKSSVSGNKFGSNGLKVNGKLFALFTQDSLVVKLSKVRVAELVASSVGKPFDPGHGRLMKEWLHVTSPRASWLDLTREAFEFVRSQSERRK